MVRKSGGGQMAGWIGGQDRMTGLPSFPGGLVVLVIEDDGPYLKLVTLLLNLDGFLALDAVTEDDAVQVARAFPGRIDLLLSDVRLGQGTGPGAAARILAFRPDVKAAFMSSDSLGTLVGEGLLEPDAAFLPKPFDSSAFRLLLQDRFAGKAPWAPAR